MKVRLFTILLLMIVSAAVVKPQSTRVSQGASIDLEAVLPIRFGDWQQVPSVQMILPVEFSNATPDAVHYAAYQDRYGRIIAVVLAHGAASNETLRLHLPENCYTAQGFVIEHKNVRDMDLAGRSFSLTGLQARSALRDEYVSYILRSGNQFIKRPLDFEAMKFSSDTTDQDDGVLLRLSSIGQGDNEEALHTEFLNTLVSELDEKDRQFILGAKQ